MHRTTATTRSTRPLLARVRTATLALATLLAAAGCDDPAEPDAELASARFEATLSGAVNTTLSGDAYSGAGENTAQLKVWAVDMDDTGGEQELFLFVRDVRIPEPGSSYRVRARDGVVPEPGEAILQYTRLQGGEAVFYEGVEGSVSITDRSAERDRGTGTFQATLVSSASDTVQVTGRFHTEEDVDGIDSLAGES